MWKSPSFSSSQYMANLFYLSPNEVVLTLNGIAVCQANPLCC